MNMRPATHVHFANAEPFSAMQTGSFNRAVLPLAWRFACPTLCSMKNLVALLCLFCASSIYGQAIKVELEFDQETYLPREPLYATVRIYNTSGRTLVLGRDNEWLSFSVENVDGSFVNQRKPLDVRGEFTLPSSSRAKKLLNLAEVYDLGKFGRYVIRADVKIPQWQETFSSKTMPLGIATGVKLWDTTFGMPSEDHQGRPELRKYQLLSANHLKRLSLYVRVTGENEADTIAIFPIGRLHGFSKPEPQMDRWSNLHVFYQDGAHGFAYNMITPDGLLLARQFWDISGEGSRPFLRIGEDGHIVVAGGVRRVTPDDLPPPDLLADNAEPPPAANPVDKPSDAKKSAK